MVAPIQSKSFIKSSEGSLASYDWTDLGEGTGIVELYGFTNDAAGTLGYILDKNAMELSQEGIVATGDEVRTDISTTATTFSLNAFNMPKVIKGICYINFTWILRNNAAPVATAKVTVAIYKNASLLVTGDTQTFTIAAAPATTAHTEVVALTIPITNFKKGDIFKVKFTGVQVTGNITVFLHHDPYNKDFTSTTPNVTAATNTTRLRVYVPFRIDV